MNNNNLEHKPIHILYGVIALAIVVWSVLYYQVKNAPPPVAQEDTSSEGLSAKKIKAELSSPENTQQVSVEKKEQIRKDLSN